jgi:hypothetical protein
MASRSVMSPPLRNQPPSDWRDRLVMILTQDGITHPPPSGNARLMACLKYLGVALPSVVAAVFIATRVNELFGYHHPGYLFSVVLCSLLGAVVTHRRMRTLHAQMQTPASDREPLTAIRNAKRPPVLFLRSFVFDAPSSEIGRRDRDLRTQEQRMTFSIKGGSDISTPILALGRPGEIAPPLGAARFYVRDDLWQSTIEAVVPLCSLVIWTTGYTESLHWEIKHLVANIAPQRLILWVHVHVGDRTRGQRNSEWRRFIEMSDDVFPKRLPPDGENIEFIAFDETWVPQALPADRSGLANRSLLRLVKMRAAEGYI